MADSRSRAAIVTQSEQPEAVGDKDEYQCNKGAEPDESADIPAEQARLFVLNVVRF
jgi:hypothetical protein